MDNTQDMLFIFVKIISLIKRVGYLGYFVTILGFGYFTKPHHPRESKITYQSCPLSFTSKIFDLVLDKVK